MGTGGARAALEATAYQTREVLDAVNADSGVPLTELKVDGAPRPVQAVAVEAGRATLPGWADDAD